MSASGCSRSRAPGAEDGEPRLLKQSTAAQNDSQHVTSQLAHTPAGTCGQWPRSVAAPTRCPRCRVAAGGAGRWEAGRLGSQVRLIAMHTSAAQATDRTSQHPHSMDRKERVWRQRSQAGQAGSRPGAHTERDLHGRAADSKQQQAAPAGAYLAATADEAGGQVEPQVLLDPRLVALPLQVGHNMHAQGAAAWLQLQIAGCSPCTPGSLPLPLPHWSNRLPLPPSAEQPALCGTAQQAAHSTHDAPCCDAGRAGRAAPRWRTSLGSMGMVRVAGSCSRFSAYLLTRRSSSQAATFSCRGGMECAFACWYVCVRARARARVLVSRGEVAVWTSDGRYINSVRPGMQGRPRACVAVRCERQPTRGDRREPCT